MILFVIRPKKFQEISLPRAVVHTFEEEYGEYLRKCKKKQWTTEEGFSLGFDTSLSDLKKCIFIKASDGDIIFIIRKQFNIIEEYEIY